VRFRLAIVRFHLAIVRFHLAIVRFHLAIVRFRLAIVRFRLAIVRFGLASVTWGPIELRRATEVNKLWQLLVITVLPLAHEQMARVDLVFSGPCHPERAAT
jgi:hypothetical protein